MYIVHSDFIHKFQEIYENRDFKLNSFWMKRKNFKEIICKKFQEVTKNKLLAIYRSYYNERISEKKIFESSIIFDLSKKECSISLQEMSDDYENNLRFIENILSRTKNN